MSDGVHAIYKKFGLTGLNRLLKKYVKEYNKIKDGDDIEEMEVLYEKIRKLRQYIEKNFDDLETKNDSGKKAQVLKSVKVKS
jgi:hypothetical protein